jgi:Plasmid encoded RepA protein
MVNNVPCPTPSSEKKREPNCGSVRSRPGREARRRSTPWVTLRPGSPLWFNAGDQIQGLSAENFENEISLSEAFYREIDEHRIPVEREVAAALAHAPGVLDFYMWLVSKSWTVNSRPVTVPLIAEHGLNKQLGSEEYAQPRLFRFKVRTWLRQVKALWPECPAAVSPTGDSIIVRSSRNNPAIRAVGKAVTR